MLSFVVLGLSFVPFIAAQSTGIAAIEAHFKNAGLTPGFIDDFKPAATLNVNFPGVGDVQPGQLLTPAQTKPEPAISVVPAERSTLAGNYTVLMLDADIVGTDLKATGGTNRHWLVNSATIADGKISVASGVAITAYAGPGPAAGSGPHRYTILIYSQPENFIAPAELQPGAGVSKMDLASYLSNTQMGPLLGGWYMTVEEGKASVSIAPTSAVNSAALGPSSAPSGPSSSTPSKTASGTNPSTSTGKNNGATTIGFSFAAIFAVALATLFL